jgi:hypothetical protein
MLPICRKAGTNMSHSMSSKRMSLCIGISPLFLIALAHLAPAGGDDNSRGIGLDLEVYVSRPECLVGYVNTFRDPMPVVVRLTNNTSETITVDREFVLPFEVAVQGATLDGTNAVAGAPDFLSRFVQIRPGEVVERVLDLSVPERFLFKVPFGPLDSVFAEEYRVLQAENAEEATSITFSMKYSGRLARLIGDLGYGTRAGFWPGETQWSHVVFRRPRPENHPALLSPYPPGFIERRNAHLNELCAAQQEEEREKEQAQLRDRLSAILPLAERIADRLPKHWTIRFSGKPEKRFISRDMELTPLSDRDSALAIALENREIALFITPKSSLSDHADPTSGAKHTRSTEDKAFGILLTCGENVSAEEYQRHVRIYSEYIGRCVASFHISEEIAGSKPTVFSNIRRGWPPRGAEEKREIEMLSRRVLWLSPFRKTEPPRFRYKAMSLSVFDSRYTLDRTRYVAAPSGKLATELDQILKSLETMVDSPY